MKASDYLKETKAEMKHVNWPTRKQAIGYTAIVIGISIVFSIFLGVFDYLFQIGLGKLIS